MFGWSRSCDSPTAESVAESALSSLQELVV